MLTERQPAQERPVFLAYAVVTDTATCGGAVRLKDDVHLGDVYVVDLYTRRPLGLLVHGVPYMAECIQVFTDGGTIPLECVRLEPADGRVGRAKV